MKFRKLGSTGLTVSALSLGTVELGIPYGIQTAGEHLPPEENEAEAILQHAVDAGVNLIDTAPAYGRSESLIGRFLSKRRDEILIATKVVAADEPGSVFDTISVSVEGSLRRLRTDYIDVLYIHSATVSQLQSVEVFEAMSAQIERSVVRCIGATTYGDAAALQAIRSGYECIQIGYNILDRSPEEEVLPAASKGGVGVFARSVLLKGALTPKAEYLPSELVGLKERVLDAARTMEIELEDLPRVAVRFALSRPSVASALVGARRVEELDQALDAADEGPLDESLLSLMRSLPVPPNDLINPSAWSPAVR